MAEVSAVEDTTFAQPWLVHHLWPFLDKQDLVKAIHALIPSRLSYY